MKKEIRTTQIRHRLLSHDSVTEIGLDSNNKVRFSRKKFSQIRRIFLNKKSPYSFPDSDQLTCGTTPNCIFELENFYFVDQKMEPLYKEFFKTFD